MVQKTTEIAKESPVVHRANYIPAPEYFLLNQACISLWHALNPVGIFLVGSSLDKRDFRDINVRCILTDADFQKYFKTDTSNSEHYSLWTLMSSSISLLLSKQSGLHVDFQIQSMKEANDFYSDKKRSAIGIIGMFITRTGD